MSSGKIKNKIETIDDYNYIDIRDITVIVPTLNEEQAIEYVLEDLQVNGYENILVVDGGSTDKTVEKVNNLKIELIPQQGNGKTGALKTAIKHINTPYFAILDGDCTYKGEDVGSLLSIAEPNVQVIGVRTKGRENIPLFNRFGNWAINTLFNLIFGTKLYDVCSGMYLLPTQFAKKMPLKTEGFDVEVEVAAYSSVKGQIKEISIGYYPRKGQQKLNSVKDGVKIFKTMIKLGLKLHTLRMIYLSSILLIIPGISLMALTWSLDLFEQIRIIGLVLIMLSLQGFTLYLVDTRTKNNHKK